MRKKIVAGNWKMHTLLKEGMELAEKVERFSKEKGDDVIVVIAPPFTHLSKIREVTDLVKLAAQNCSSEESGAYTGEVSPDMLLSAGAEYVILGHSERRAYYHEDNHLLNKKIRLALDKGLKPIYCCGEVLAEREAGKLFEVVKDQLTVGLQGLNTAQFSQVIIAYEPVWAIGTGITATPAQAQEMHAFIRNLIADMYDDRIAGETTILYGGSCKPSNARELFANPDVDGGLIGGASLKAEDFIQIVNAF
ncbi:MAG: triose-phosphate isomerase [Bacteroidales bacterium]|nr:triose-phosphate isomerase [Bacteroidales bacterium]MBN2697268.1 triose-phosphate isomerase [Bacteroidales bacterium]